MNKRIVHFVPEARDDGRWAIGIRFDGSGISVWFVHWIEGDSRRICKSSRKDMCFSLYCEDEAQAVCEMLNDWYEKGEIV